MLSILHNDMHSENYNFTLFYFKNTILEKNLLSNMKIIKETLIENPFINIPEGFLHQGHNINKNKLAFDNETPSFLVKIKKFKVSKYPITEYQFLEFVLDNGYNNIKYWSNKGLEWKKQNNIKNPLYWLNINNLWYRKHINCIYKVGSNLPICNISWYEAEAYCKWKNVRFITESEWEYLATNLGRNTYPWGDNEPTTELCNINNKYNYCVDVNLYKSGENRCEVSQLIGNIWEWCEEEFFPYPNFTMDYVYREMSYPFFGQKKICRGGCFCVKDYLIHSKYRNSQDPGCQIQYIGFRVCLKSS
jgi:iron(II)-dependent oxidoreductase